MTALALGETVRGIRDLPSLPAIVLELLATLEQEDAASHLLAGRISQDQALSAKMLRLANSSFYGVAGGVRTIPQAIAVLGFGTIRTLVAAASIHCSFSRKGSPGFDFEQFWRHAIATALCAKAMAAPHGVQAEAAFIAGLLHDIGQIVIATQFPVHYEAVLAYRAAGDCALIAAEHAVIGIDHAMVGAELAAHWRFPAAIREAVAHHHERHGPEDAGLSGVLQLASAFAHALDLAGVHDEAAPPVDDMLWARLPHDTVAIARMLAEIEAEYLGICRILVE